MTYDDDIELADSEFNRILSTFMEGLPKETIGLARACFRAGHVAGRLYADQNGALASEVMMGSVH